jgi:tRNA pseudouridine65 synthase
MPQRLEIIYHDANLVAINKPPGLLVHRTSIAADADEFAIQVLRNQIGQKVTPVHRLDRKTSGVLVFALDIESNRNLNEQFLCGEVKKTYWAIVRGYTPDFGTIDYPLKKENGTFQEAITHFKTIKRTEVPVPLGKHQTQRYSLVKVKPETGRMHQIRKHFAHIFHPVIGDRPHGCNKQNRLFKEQWQMTQMLLHAQSIQFKHPINDELIRIVADVPDDFLRMLKILAFENCSA